MDDPVKLELRSSSAGDTFKGIIQQRNAPHVIFTIAKCARVPSVELNI